MQRPSPSCPSSPSSLSLHQAIVSHVGDKNTQGWTEPCPGWRVPEKCAFFRTHFAVRSPTLA